MIAPLPSDEPARLAALRDYDVLDSPPEKAFDDLTQLASYICQAPVALMTLLDADRQWFKSRIGFEQPETSRDVAFCSHAILQDDLFVVPDAQADPRFADNPLVTQQPHVRFYAGAPLATPSGHAIGTLCVLDEKPRSLTPEQQNALRTLSRQAVSQLELRRALVRERAYQCELRAEQERGEQLLLNILPAPIAQRLKQNAETIADHYDSATVLFADLQNFGSMTRHLRPCIFQTC
jgi:GAF domain-containing protein